MTEDVKVEIDTPDTPEPQEREFSELENKALDMGWRPREEFDGSDDDFIDAKEFVRRKPLFDKIDATTRELKSTRKGLEAFKQHYTNVEKIAVEKAITRLTAERKEAITIGDGDKFAEVDAELKLAEKQQEHIHKLETTPVVEDTAPPHPEFAAWTNRNQWYQQVSYMRKYADEFGTNLEKQGVQPSEVLKEVEKAVRKEFPNKFTNSNKASAPHMESGSRPAAAGTKVDKFEATLNAEERKTMDTLVRGGHLTKEKYLNDLKAIKAIK